MQNRKITPKFITKMKDKYSKSQYSLPKWVQFIEVMLSHKYQVSLYEAKSTFSKYIYITRGKKEYKVRFSNHKPNRTKESINDCDFFVGVTNFAVTRTEDAIIATHNYFKEDVCPQCGSNDVQNDWANLICNKCNHKWATNKGQ